MKNALTVVSPGPNLPGLGEAAAKVTKAGQSSSIPVPEKAQQ